MKIYIALKDNLERIFLSDKKRLKSKLLIDNQTPIIVEEYIEFFTMKIGDSCTLICIPEKAKIVPHKDFIEVTDNRYYFIKNLINHSVIKTNIIIEGADGTGKSTLVSQLANQGYLCQDRAIKEITQSMREEIPKKTRISNVYEYLLKEPKRKVVFLYLSKEEELEKRILARGDLSEYDKKALIFQRLYLDTYESLKNLPNLYLIDAFQKTPKQLANEIRKLV